jgi:hypothetical protein
MKRNQNRSDSRRTVQPNAPAGGREAAQESAQQAQARSRITWKEGLALALSAGGLLLRFLAWLTGNNRGGVP